MKQINFNKIYVIESLGNDEKKTGSLLHNDIISRKIEQNKLKCEHALHTVSTRADFFKLFSIIRDEAIFGLVDPLLHFEIHGCIGGFILNSGELVSWTELQSHLVKLNVLSKNSTLLTLSTCYGGQIFKAINIRTWTPFWGFVGPMNEVLEDQVTVGFHEFFEELLTSGDFLLAVEKLNQESEVEVPFYFFNAEYVFKKVYAIYEQKYLTDEYIGIRIENGLQEIRATNRQLDHMNDEEVREILRKILTQDSGQMKADIMDRFLMYDLYPDLKPKDR